MREVSSLPPSPDWAALGVPVPRDPGLAAKVLARVEVVVGGCWVSPLALIPKGYSRMDHEGVKSYLHRWSWTAWNGPIPCGLEIDHVRANGCESRACGNPLHLEAVTSQENCHRADSPAGLNARKVACQAGHPFTAANTLERRIGRGRQRECRECRRARERRYRADRRLRDALLPESGTMHPLREAA